MGGRVAVAALLPGQRITLTSRTGDGEFEVVPVTEVPLPYWEFSKTAWAVSIFEDGEWHFHDSPPIASEIHDIRAITGDGKQSRPDLAVLIPVSFLEPKNNEWGEVAP